MTGNEASITIIIADYSQSDSVVDCLKNLNSWFPKKIIVSNDFNARSRLKDYPSHDLILHKSQSISQLWQQGISASKTQWNLLISSNEIVTGHLKKSIENQIKTQPTSEKLFNIKKRVVFLKKVLKYPLEWPAEFPSCLIFIPQKNSFTLEEKSQYKNVFLSGELLHFSSPTIEDGVKEIFRLSEIEADRVFYFFNAPKLIILIIKTTLNIVYEFFYELVYKKAFKEGLEGIIFSAMRSMIPIFSLFRYFEKYHRSGKRIETELDSIKNILIIKIRGAGDLIITTPFLRNLKKLLPLTNIHLLVTEGSAPLLDNNPHIKSIFKINHDCNKSALKKLLPKLKQLKLGLAINLDSTSRTSRLLKKIPSKRKIDRSYYFRDKNTDVLIGFTNTFRSIIEREFDILRAIGLKPIDKNTEIFLNEEEIDWAKKFFIKNGLSSNKKTIVVAASSSLKIRDWGIENFTLLCKNLTTGDDIQIIVNATPNEISYISPIINLSSSICVFSGSLRELLGVINESDLLIGNDSGPTHFSIALNVPTIILNGPSTSTFYRDPEVVKKPHYVFNKDVPCRDLLHTQCFSDLNPITRLPSCNEMICLEFTVNDVANKARTILNFKKVEEIN